MEKKLIVQVSMMWDEGPDTVIMIFTVPESVTEDMVIEELKNMHETICEDEDGDDIYSNAGRTPDILAGAVCRKNGWKMEILLLDIKLEFD